MNSYSTLEHIYLMIQDIDKWNAVTSDNEYSTLDATPNSNRIATVARFLRSSAAVPDKFNDLSQQSKCSMNGSSSKSFLVHRRSTSWPTKRLSVHNIGLDCGEKKAIVESNTNDTSDVPNGNPLLKEYDYRTVDDRVLAMLAATAALKPSPTPSPVVGSSMFVKVSNVLDRIYSKNSRCTRRASQAQLCKHLKTSPASSPRQPSPRKAEPAGSSSLTTIEMRLNEGNNLNRRKVQRIVGGSISRKPVPGQGHGLRARPDEPIENFQSHAEPNMKLSITTAPTSELSEIPKRTISDPFISEQNFEDDLVNGFLSTSPAASSTPKSKILRYARQIENIHNASIENKRLIIYKDISPPRNTTEDEGCLIHQMTDDVFSEPHSPPAVKLKLPTTALKDHKKVKKHPSPSKNALEDLEMAFTKYVHMRGRGDKDVDELATSLSIAPPLLVPQDGNRHMEHALEKRMRRQAVRESSPLGRRPRSPSMRRNVEGSKTTLKAAFPHLVRSHDPSCVDELQD